MMKSTFLASGLDEFVGFAKVTISDRKFPVRERRQVAKFHSCCYFHLGRFTANLVDGEHAAKFEKFAKSTRNMDHTVAEQELRKYHSATSKHFKSGTSVSDSSTNTLLRVDVKLRKKRYTNGWLVYRKAVKLDLSS
jgi:hypothetical protein